MIELRQRPDLWRVQLLHCGPPDRCGRHRPWLVKLDRGFPSHHGRTWATDKLAGIQKRHDQALRPEEGHHSDASSTSQVQYIFEFLHFAFIQGNQHFYAFADFFSCQLQLRGICIQLKRNHLVLQMQFLFLTGHWWKTRPRALIIFWSASAMWLGSSKRCWLASVQGSPWTSNPLPGSFSYQASKSGRRVKHSLYGSLWFKFVQTSN